MRTYVINLRRRPDRRAHMEQMLGRLRSSILRRASDFAHICPDGTLDVVFTTDWKGPLDGKQMDRNSLRGFGLLPWRMACSNQWWSRPLKKGEIGNSISHWRCWKDAASRDESRALVFEDDAVLTESFLDKFSQAVRTLDSRHRDWDFLYLGRLRRDIPPTPLGRDVPIDDGLVRPGYSQCAQAYMLTRAGLEKILSVGFENHLIPVDEFLPALY